MCYVEKLRQVEDSNYTYLSLRSAVKLNQVRDSNYSSGLISLLLRFNEELHDNLLSYVKYMNQLWWPGEISTAMEIEGVLELWVERLGVFSWWSRLDRIWSSIILEMWQSFFFFWLSRYCCPVSWLVRFCLSGYCYPVSWFVRWIRMNKLLNNNDVC